MSSPAAVFSATLRSPLSVAGKAGEIEVRVNVRFAIRLAENLPVPRILWMTPRGLVSTLGLSEKSLPSSLPASHGYRKTRIHGSQSPCALSRGNPETPTNQSWLGAIIVVRVTRGNAVVSSTSLSVFEPVGMMLPDGLRTARAVAGVALVAALTSLRSCDVCPSSAIDSTPALAAPPLSRKVTPAPCTPRSAGRSARRSVGRLV